MKAARVIWVFVAAALAGLLAASLTGCAPTDPNGTRSEQVIAVEAALGSYDEAAFRLQMAEEKDVTLARDGHSDYAIVLGQGAGAIASDAAYLQGVLRRMVGDADAFPIRDAMCSPAIVLGADPACAELAEVRDDGYALFFRQDDLYLSGVTPSGTANAVYSFLENRLGCMFVREDWDYVPSLPTISLTREQVTDNPDFVWRRVYQYEVNQNGWGRRLKSNGTGEKNQQGNDANAGWGTWCHSAFDFVPPSEYFDTHPEYFALVAGKRRAQYRGSETQLCLTNPDLFAIIRQNMEKRMAQQPDAIYWDFSINDNEYVCTCSQCRRAKRKYGSDMGAMLVLLNRLAAAFPDKFISTLAYYYNATPPKGVTPADNVNIVIAPIASSQLYSAKYGAGSSRSATTAIEGWGKICKNLFVWDYVVDFAHLLLPYPNFAVQRENLEFYAAHNVRRIFHQGNREKEGEQARLRSYLLARQLWDMQVDVNALLGKYLTVTLGEGAPYVASYLDEMHAAVFAEAADLDLYDAPAAHAGDYLSAAHLASYRAKVDAALLATAGDARAHRCVQEYDLSLSYAQMMVGGSREEKQQAASRFSALAHQLGVERVQEAKQPDLDTFLAVNYPAYLDGLEQPPRLQILLPLFVSLGTIGGCVLLAALAVLTGRLLKKRKGRAKSGGEAAPEQEERKSA